MGASALTSSTGMRRRRRMETVKGNIFSSLILPFLYFLIAVLSLVHNGALWGQGPPQFIVSESLHNLNTTKKNAIIAYDVGPTIKINICGG